MSLRVYNTLSREKEPFAPLRPGNVGIYLCGPTVYKPPHIGHLVGPVIFDTIKRYLVFKGYKVEWVINITDVDDKIINEAAARGVPFKQLADSQTELYLQILERLSVRANVDYFPKASEHMPDIVAMIERLIAKGHAYASENGDVWFDTASDPNYGRLSNRKLADQEAGQRDLAGQGKKAPADFALWKSAKPGEPAWQSPWGQGRPGWHIECSAMSARYLGDTFDIHGGGDDLKFPHHENELAQSSCAHNGQMFVKYWMHNGLTRIKTKAASGEWKSEKMSKSLGNTIDARALVDTHGPDAVRYLLLSTHYRSPIEFSDDVVDANKKALAVFTRLIERAERMGIVCDTATLAERYRRAISVAAKMGEDLESVVFHGDRNGDGEVDGEDEKLAELARPFEDKYVASMDDDFNTAGAIAAMHELAGALNGAIEKSGVEQTRDPAELKRIAAGVRRLRGMAGLLGLTLAPVAKPPSDSLAEPLMQLIIKLRADARGRKDFATADAIRTGLSELKITLEDKKDGTVWRKE